MKGICDYTIAPGVKCTRAASKTLGNREYCWQHIKPARQAARVEKIKIKQQEKEEKKLEKESKKRKAPKDEKTEKRQKQETVEETVVEIKNLSTHGRYCEGFIECAQKVEKEGYDIYIIPKGTILFHGTNYKFPDDVIPNTPAYFASFDHAIKYAFMSTHSPENRGSAGKVITVQAKRDIKILNATARSVKNLAQLSGFPTYEFSSALGYGKEELRRRSASDIDDVVTKWICSKKLFDGWGNDLKGFHPEVILCKTDMLQRYDIEYRVDGKFPDYIFKMENGALKEAFVYKPKDNYYDIWYTGTSMLDKDTNRYLKPQQKSDKDYVAALEGLDFPEVD
jgi:hypothetical protein